MASEETKSAALGRGEQIIRGPVPDGLLSSRSTGKHASVIVRLGAVTVGLGVVVVGVGTPSITEGEVTVKERLETVDE